MFVSELWIVCIVEKHKLIILLKKKKKKNDFKLYEIYKLEIYIRTMTEFENRMIIPMQKEVETFYFIQKNFFAFVYKLVFFKIRWRIIYSTLLIRCLMFIYLLNVFFILIGNQKIKKEQFNSTLLTAYRNRLCAFVCLPVFCCCYCCYSNRVNKLISMWVMKFYWCEWCLLTH